MKFNWPFIIILVLAIYLIFFRQNKVFIVPADQVRAKKDIPFAKIHRVKEQTVKPTTLNPSIVETNQGQLAYDELTQRNSNL